jgi:hypothetical protein
MGENMIGWEPPQTDLHEFEARNNGFVRRRPGRKARGMIVGAIVAIAIFLALALAECQTPVLIGAKMPPPVDRASVAADARYP